MADLHVNDEKREADHYTHATDDDVCDSEEWISAAEPRGCRQDHTFCSAEHDNWICCRHHKHTNGYILLNSSGSAVSFQSLNAIK